MRTLILDNEAVNALWDRHHPHHRAALAVIEANRRGRRGDKARRTVVPTTVRVEAGWDRRAPGAAAINQLRIADVPLDPALADAAALLVSAHRVSLADAHLGAVIGAFAGDEISVMTSDPDDMRSVAGSVPIEVITL